MHKAPLFVERNQIVKEQKEYRSRIHKSDGTYNVLRGYIHMGVSHIGAKMPLASNVNITSRDTARMKFNRENLIVRFRPFK